MSNTISNPAVAVTNNASVSVDIYDVYNPSSDSGPYTYTKLGTIESNESAAIQTIRAASQLLATYSGTVTPATVPIDVERFPVAVFAASILDESPLHWTITASNYLGAQQAFLFAKYSNANPDSVTVKDFNTALKLAPKDDGKAVDDFFAKTANFPKATYIGWLQIISWQTQSLSAWVGTYYLYSTDKDAPEGVDPVELQAVVSITNESGMVRGNVYAANDAHDYKNGQHTAISQSGKGPIETSGRDISLSLSVTPIWTNIRTVDDNNKPSYKIGGALTGTFNGTEVSGSGQIIDLPKTHGSGSSSINWNDVLKWQAALGSVFGNLVSFGMLYIMIKEYNMKKEEARDRVVNNANDPVNNREQVRQDQNQAVNDVAAQEEPHVEAQEQLVQQAADQLPQAREAVNDAQDRVQVGDAVQRLSERIRTLLEEVPVNDAIIEATEHAERARQNLEDGHIDEAFQNLRDASARIQEAAQAADTRFQQEQQDEAADIAREVQQEHERRAAEQRAQQDEDREREQPPEDRIPDDHFDPPGPDVEAE